MFLREKSRLKHNSITGKIGFNHALQSRDTSSQNDSFKKLRL